MKKLIIFVFVLLAINIKVANGENLNYVTLFNSIELNADVQVILTQSDQQSVSIDADENTHNLIETKVRNNILIINETGTISKLNPVKVYVSMKSLNRIIVTGSGTVITQSKFIADDLSLCITGKGNISMDIAANTISSEIAGNGNIKLKGMAGTHSFTIAGGGNLDAVDLETFKTFAMVASSGNCYLNVKDNLDIKMYGNGSLVYKGSPKITMNKSIAMGKVEAL